MGSHRQHKDQLTVGQILDHLTGTPRDTVVNIAYVNITLPLLDIGIGEDIDEGIVYVSLKPFKGNGVFK